MEENREFVEEAVNYLEKIGFENIHTNLEGYDTPKSYYKKDSDVVITPDISAERSGVKHYFEISLKTPETDILKSKWQFLEALTQMRSQEFRIITRRGHMKFTNELLKELNIEKELIRL